MGVLNWSSPQPHIFTNTMKVLLATSCLLAVAAALPRPDAPPAYGAAPAYPDVPASYTYSWAVKDDYTNNNYGQDEKRDGGYVAEVTYEGEAQFPEAKPYAPAPAAYAPAP